jgi:hypothetical protein
MRFKIKSLGHISAVMMDCNHVDIRKAIRVGQQIKAPWRT